MSDDGIKGAQTPNSISSDYNAQMFVIMQALTRVRTSQLVRVEAVTNSGGLEAVGFVDVVPMVHQLDGDNQPVPHGVIYGIPYIRVQGGTNAVIIDPQKGDIGLCVFADRDISTVKATKDAAPPGSARVFSMADGLYVGGVLNGVPTQYVRFTEDGVEVVSPSKIRLVAPTVEIAASTGVQIDTPNVAVSTKLTVPILEASTRVTAPLVEGTEDVKFDGGKSAKTHRHSGGTISGNTGMPLPL